MALKEIAITNLYLNVSLNCNQACRRCYHHRGLSADRQMTLETAREATRLYFATRDPQAQNPFIMLFGGEPLCNWDVVREYIPWVRSACGNEPFDLFIFTNGIDLTEERADFFFTHGMMTVMSLNGPYEHHNRHRPMPRAQYDHVAAMVKYIAAKDPRKVTPYLVLSREMLAELPDVLRFFAGLGITQMAISKDVGDAWGDALKREIASAIQSVLGPAGITFRFFPEAISNCRNCYPKSLVVYPNGDLYDLCHLCSSVLQHASAADDAVRRVMHFGQLGQTDRLFMDVEAKRALITPRMDCMTGPA